MGIRKYTDAYMLYAGTNIHICINIHIYTHINKYTIAYLPIHRYTDIQVHIYIQI